MSSAHYINARKCVHEQKPYPCQALAYESSKVGGRGKERKIDRKDRGQETDGKKAAQQNKNRSMKLKEGLPSHS